MYQVGVVGPKGSVERIVKIAQRSGTPLAMKPIVYETAIDVPQVIDEKGKNCDYFLFSGIIPYIIGKDVIDPKRAFYVELLEAGFYRAMLNVMHQVDRLQIRFGIDLPEQGEVAEHSLEQLNMPVQLSYVEYFDPYDAYQMLIDKHTAAWEADEVDGVLTCYPEVKAVLSEQGIPVEWISTTNLATRQVIQAIEQRAEADYFKRTQIAACAIQIFGLEKRGALSFDIQTEALRIQMAMLQMSRQLNGSFFTLGHERYMIMTSRGEVYDQLSKMQLQLEHIHNEYKLTLRVGIGFGDSALQAEQYATEALHYSKTSEQSIAIASAEEEKVPQFMDQVEQHAMPQLDYLHEQFQESKVALHHVESLYRTILSKKWTTFTTQDVMLELAIGSRTAQRLVKTLVEADVLLKVGEEKRGGKGRPSPLYEWTLT